jgi:SAM-dependent methyltransferase
VSFVQSLIARQRSLRRSFDHRFVRKDFRRDGNHHFVSEFVPGYLRPGAVVYDIGGGKQPLISLARKKELGLTVVGLDIDPTELSRAPVGIYDRVVCADIQSYRGIGDADLVICQAVLEHVPSLRAALKGVFSALKPDGLAIVFVPCRNAGYARLNLLLPQRLKRRILFYVAPEAEHDQGFRAYYDCCTPRRFRTLIGECDGSVVEEQFYYVSSYFSFCLPVYVLWRLWVSFFHLLAGEQAAESFSLAFSRKRLAAIQHTEPEANQKLEC